MLERMNSLLPVVKRIKSKDFEGSSPPAVFVGRWNYPKVNVGILVPQMSGDTSILDEPERWYENKNTITDVMRYRSELINSHFVSNVKIPEKFVELAREIAISKKSVDTEVVLKKLPRFRINYDSYYPPVGPSAGLKRAKIIGNPSADGKVERLVYDTDVSATTAVNELYGHVSVTELAKIFSVGLLGRMSQRRLVPTRWSITAVDDTVGKRLIGEIEGYQWIDKIQVFSNSYLGNKFTIFLIPRQWSFELIEIYYPGSVWLRTGKTKTVSDFENHFGRKNYADNTGFGACHQAGNQRLLRTSWGVGDERGREGFVR